MKWGVKVQIIKHLIMQSLPIPFYLVPLRPKYLPQHPTLKHSKPMLLPQCGRPSFKPVKKTSKITVLYILSFVFLERNVQDKIFCTESKQAFPAFSLLLISSWIKFWFPRDIPKYLNLSTHSQDLLLIFMLRFCPACWCTDMAIHLLATKEGETASFSESLSQCSLLQRGISPRPWRTRLRSVEWTSWSQHRKYKTNQFPHPQHGSQKEAP